MELRYWCVGCVLDAGSLKCVPPRTDYGVQNQPASVQPPLHPVNTEATAGYPTGYPAGNYSVSQDSAPLPPPPSTISTATPTSHPPTSASITAGSGSRHGEVGAPPQGPGDGHVTRQAAGDEKEKEANGENIHVHVHVHVCAYTIITTS